MVNPAKKEKPAGPESASLPTDARSPLTEAFRTVRANLVYLGVDKPLRSLLVTSAVPKEGKTTTVANMGVTMALAGTRVLLVDTDLRRPALHQFFQLNAKPGLTSLFGDQADPAQVIQGTKVPGLFVLPSGPHVPNPNELLGSRRMAELVKRLQDQYDVLVLDSPPMFATADPLVLAGISDGVILVLRSGSVPRDVASRVKQQLESVKANILGVVLNAFDFKREAYYSSSSYYYYYYYGYRGGYGYGNSKPDGHGPEE